MSANISKHISNGVMSVKFSGRLTFSDREEFRSIINSIEDVNKVNMDFENVEFVDSAVLGLLLLIKEAGEKKDVSINLCKPQGQVKKMLYISEFDKLFNIIE